jgi:hypothetical protein
LVASYILLSPFLPLVTGYGVDHGWAAKLLLSVTSLWFELPLLALVIAGLIWGRADKPGLGLAGKLALAFVVLAVLSYLWTDRTLSYHLIGLRFALLPFLFFLLGKFALVRLDEIVRVLRPVVMVVAALAILQALLWVLAPGWLDGLGLGTEFLAGALPRLYGTLGGPNQLAFYLGAALLILLLRHPPGRNLPGQWFVFVLAVLVPFTASRSVTLALALALLYAVITHAGAATKLFKTALVALIASSLLWLAVSALGPAETSGLVRAESDSIRLETFALVKQNFLDSSPWQWLIGHGAGTAGPATFSAHGAFITENWFLQVAYEYGLAGLLLVGAFALAVWRRTQARVLLIFAAVVSMFLHSLSDNPAAANLIFIALAAMLNVADDNLAAAPAR